VHRNTTRALLATGAPERAGRHAAALTEHGIAPTLAFAAEQLSRFVERYEFDVVVIDLALLERAEALLDDVRARTDAPLLVLQDHHDGQLPQRVLDLAALGPREPETASRWGPLELDHRLCRVTFDESPVPVTPIQFRLLHALVRARGAVRTKTELARAVWGTALPEDAERVVAHVRRIRARIEPDPTHPTFVLTVRGEGFRLADDG
jgi:DNA-binding response OmpR family regulator